MNQLPLLIKSLISIENIIIYVPIRHASTTVENSLQITLFMQNKPNFLRSQMNVNIYNKTDYENIANWTLGQNKPNSNPIQTLS